MSMRRHVLMFLAVMVIASLPQTCLGAPINMKVFLKTLPITAMDSDFVAVVEILETANVDVHKIDGSRVPVKVITIIAGSYDDESLQVELPKYMFYNGPRVTKGEHYFIAGHVAEGIFEGKWTTVDFE